MPESSRDHPDIIALPPLIYLGAFLLGLILEYFWRSRILTTLSARMLFGVALVVAGFLLGFRAFREFQRIGTNVEVYKPATALATRGPYRYTRNPIYVALTLAYAGAALLADSVWVLAFLAPVVVIVHFGVILPEEQYLGRKFGEHYRQYQKSVRRWM